MTERDKVKQKIIKLLAVTTSNGASLSEAMNAMDKASHLMAFYQINITELQIRSTRCVHKTIDIKRYGNSIVLDSAFFYIKNLFDVIVWIDGDNYALYGFPEDVELAIHYKKFIDAALDRALVKAKSDPGWALNSHSTRTKTVSFMKGFEQAIIGKLKEFIKDKKEPVTGSQLVVLKDETIKASFSTDFPDLKFGKGVTRKIAVGSMDLFQSGYDSGSRLQLNKGVKDENESEKRKLIE